MPIENGNKVKVDYTGTFEDGTVFDSSTHGDHSHPLEFEVGAKQVISGFEEAVIGMEKGQEKDITIEPKDAYGDANPELTKRIPRDKLPKEHEPQVGMVLMMVSPEGQQIPARITEVDDKEVTIDLNHPLAGKVLKFNIKIVDYE
ncbi:peptidylprolyl isomerase [Candidatus Woesearchaeota archaeon]|nr:peptidylprolyl isomerase [Candidatus Woesearchaeota archaeon]